MSEPAPAPYYVTTPIYYVNDRPHIGHVFTTLLADVLARAQRLRGRQTFFLTGTDEHAAKVVDAARERGLEPQAWADQNAEAFRRAFAWLGSSHDDFIRTTEPRHKERVERYVAALIAADAVYLGEYEGWYDAGQEEYVQESKAKEHGYLSPINGKPLVKRKEENYFFRLSRYAPRLLEAIESGAVEVLPVERRNEVLARIREGLNDIPMSRAGSTEWGIRVPGDPKHTIYVWIDALFNYLTAVDTDERRATWPADVHYVGKDILWFHTVIWFSLLLALRDRPGYEWVALPRCVYAHSFWMSEGRKMSKSLGNFLDLERLEGFAADFSRDGLRWFLATQGPLGTADSDFSHDRFVEVYNSELANALGNCLSRVTQMTRRYFGGVLPPDAALPAGAPDLAAAAREAVAESAVAWEALAIERALSAGIGLVRAVDGFIERTQPFKLVKDPARRDEVGAVLHRSAEALRIASLLLWPAMPAKIEALWERLGCARYTAALAERGRGDLAAWSRWGGLAAGTALGEGEALFPRYQPPRDDGAARAAGAGAEQPGRKIPTTPGAKPEEKTTVTDPDPAPAALPDAGSAVSTAAPAAPSAAEAPAAKPEVTYEQFAALDIRIARVVHAEPVPKTDKLLKVELELADGERKTVLSGIRAWYAPEAIVGRQVVYLKNLAPRKMRGILSEGMILAANGPSGEAILLAPEQPAPDGAAVS